MKGILLCGGSGSRLDPGTRVVNKHFAIVYDKPMIYYSLSLFGIASVRDITVVCRPEDIQSFQNLLSDCGVMGYNFVFVEQAEGANGICGALSCAATLVGDSPVMVVLGDNFLFGSDLISKFSYCSELCTSESMAVCLSTAVPNPECFGVLSISEEDLVIDIEEKPDNPDSNEIAIGVYWLPKGWELLLGSIKPSARGELEIADLLRFYATECRLRAFRLGRGCVWFDMGTPDALLDTANFVRQVQASQGLIISCLEEFALRNSWSSKQDIRALEQAVGSKSTYWSYVRWISNLDEF